MIDETRRRLLSKAALVVSSQAVTAPAAVSASCSILSLTLSPLRLDLLGFVIDLNQVVSRSDPRETDGRQAATAAGDEETASPTASPPASSHASAPEAGCRAMRCRATRTEHTRYRRAISRAREGPVPLTAGEVAGRDRNAPGRAPSCRAIRIIARLEKLTAERDRAASPDDRDRASLDADYERVVLRLLYRSP